jgi:hypothetical protein
MKFYLNLYFIFLIQLVITKKPLRKPPPRKPIKKKPKSKPKEKFISKYDDLIKWGLNNSLNISKPLKFNKKNRFIAEKFITIDDIIMDIPPNVMLNINKSLSLLKSKKMRNDYKLYIEEDKKSKLKNQTIEDEFHIDQSFLSYILYLVNHNPKKYEKTEFYKFYKYIFYMFEDNLDHLPFYFSSEQMRLFSNTTFGNVFETLNRYLNDEASIFKKLTLKKSTESEEYLIYKIFSVQKYFNISGCDNIAPLFDIIKKSNDEPKMYIL